MAGNFNFLWQITGITLEAWTATNGAREKVEPHYLSLKNKNVTFFFFLLNFLSSLFLASTTLSHLERSFTSNKVLRQKESFWRVLRNLPNKMVSTSTKSSFGHFIFLFWRTCSGRIIFIHVRKQTFLTKKKTSKFGNGEAVCWFSTADLRKKTTFFLQKQL